MMRQVAFLMWASKGGLPHSEIMGLTWRQFHVYLDSFTWLIREGTEEGRKDNRRDDMKAQIGDSRIKAWKKRLVAEAKRRLAKMR